MNYIFFGSPQFAAIVLGKLIETGSLPIAVVVSPDRPQGRKHEILPSPVKLLAEQHHIPVLQPEKKVDIKTAVQSLNLPIDFFVVAAYAKIIPQEVLDLPRLGTIGVHPSLLPRHRGASPIQTTILEGDVETGTTLYLMDAETDHGPVLAKGVLGDVNPSELTYQVLLEKLAAVSGHLLVKTLPDFEAGKITPDPQDESLATFTKKYETEDGFVSFEKLQAALENGSDASTIDRKIKALNPEPGTWTTTKKEIKLGHVTISGGKRLKLLESKVVDGKLKLVKIQPEGKNIIELA